jgi:hypothetical protein
MTDRRYIPTTFEVRCKCHKTLNIRTKEAEHKIRCWNCNREVIVKLGLGKNNFSITIDGERIKPQAVMQ